MDQNKRFDNSIVLRKRKVFDGDLAWKNHNCNQWEIWAGLSRQVNNIKHFLNYLTVEILFDGSQTLIFQSNQPLEKSGVGLGRWWNKSSKYLLRNKCFSNSADLNSARHGQFQEKERKRWRLNWIFSFRKKFRGKLIMQWSMACPGYDYAFLVRIVQDPCIREILLKILEVP